MFLHVNTITSLSFYPNIFQHLSNYISKGAEYVEKNIGSTSDPYAVAIASYALANAGRMNSDLLFKFASSGKPENKYIQLYIYSTIQSGKFMFFGNEYRNNFVYPETHDSVIIHCYSPPQLSMLWWFRRSGPRWTHSCHGRWILSVVSALGVESYTTSYFLFFCSQL